MSPVFCDVPFDPIIVELWFILKPCRQPLFEDVRVAYPWVEEMHAFVCDLPCTLVVAAMFPRPIGNMDVYDTATVSVVVAWKIYAWRVVGRLPNRAENESWVRLSEHALECGLVSSNFRFEVLDEEPPSIVVHVPFFTAGRDSPCP